MATNKREALLRHLSGDADDAYIPAAFFLHFGEEYKSGRAAINRHIEFFDFTNMDFSKIQFELAFPRIKISTRSDYSHIPCLPLEYYKPQLEVVEGILGALKSRANVLLTLYSPFMIAGQMVGQSTLIDDLELDPEPVLKAIDSISESLIGFIRECHRLGLDGFYHSTQGAEVNRFQDPDTFARCVQPSDLMVMNEIADHFPLNILHICDYHQEYGGYADLTPFHGYPGHIVNVSTEIGHQSVTPLEISNWFGRPFLGGMNRLGALATGTPEEASDAARQVLATLPKGAILGADCTVPATTSWENLRSAIAAAHCGS